ncbi:hypothetical protein AB2B41_22395, partial [Marimonas sp. MJW-29]
PLWIIADPPWHIDAVGGRSHHQSHPEEIMRELFGGIGPISVLGDEVTMCGITMRKVELADKVAAKITQETKYPDEVEKKLFSVLNQL